jgi:outer membrane protein TolC
VQRTDLEVQRTQYEHAIAVLIGKPPDRHRAVRLLPHTFSECYRRFSGNFSIKLVQLAEPFLGRGPRLIADHLRRWPCSAKNITVAQYDDTVANYRQTVLTGFQQVEDNLAALRVLENEAQQQHEATTSAEQSLDLFQTRYEGGVDTYLQVVTWQTAALNNQRNDLDILQRRLDASVLLIKALGGGWDTTKTPHL